MSANPIYTVPSTFTMATEETWPLGFDTTNVGGPPSSPVVELWDETADEAVTLGDAATISGNVITQVVRGSALVAQHRYRLQVGFTVNSVTIPLMVLRISVPQ